MPNWTTNRVYCKNLKSLIKDGKLLFPKDGNIVDFERLLPMPKSLDISSPVDVDAVVAYLTDDFKLPITEELIRKVHEICFKNNFFVRLDDTRKYVFNAVNNRKPGEMVDLKISFDETSEMIPLRDKGRIYVENHMKYGHASWYDWACDVWGTKWNAAEPYWVDDDILEFSSAWSPPIGFFKALAKEFPDQEFRFLWADEDYSSGCGFAIAKNGKIAGKCFEPGDVNSYRTAIYLLGELYDGYLEEEGGSWAHTYKEALSRPLTNDLFRGNIVRSLEVKKWTKIR